jgi:hypothetical protein
MLRFASGKWYAGKGDLGRMVDSAARITSETGDLLISSEWSPANGTADSYVQEALRIREAGGIGPNSYNRINQPGERYIQEALASLGCG